MIGGGGIHTDVRATLQRGRTAWEKRRPTPVYRWLVTPKRPTIILVATFKPFNTGRVYNPFTAVVVLHCTQTNMMSIFIYNYIYMYIYTRYLIMIQKRQCSSEGVDPQPRTWTSA